MKPGACWNMFRRRSCSSAVWRSASTCFVVSVHTTRTPPTPVIVLSSSIGL
jgi:hypothetical protein